MYSAPKNRGFLYQISSIHSQKMAISAKPPFRRSRHPLSAPTTISASPSAPIYTDSFFIQVIIYIIFIYIYLYIYRYSHADTQTPSAEEPAPPKPAGRLPFLPLKTPFSPCTKLFFGGEKAHFSVFFLLKKKKEREKKRKGDAPRAGPPPAAFGWLSEVGAGWVGRGPGML